jgi:hypothetical protein
VLGRVIAGRGVVVLGSGVQVLSAGNAKDLLDNVGDFPEYHHRALDLCLSAIFSENRCTRSTAGGRLGVIYVDEACEAQQFEH